MFVLQLLKKKNPPQSAVVDVELTPTLFKIFNDVDKVYGSGFCSVALAKLMSKQAPMQDTTNLEQSREQIIHQAGPSVSAAFHALQDPDTTQSFALFLKDPQKNNYYFMLRLLSLDTVSIDLGGPMDDLHDQAPLRQAYLDSLSTLQILSLLLSNPKYFCTSSNQQLIQRLKADLHHQGVSVTDWLERNNLIQEKPELCKNLLYRLINYDLLLVDERHPNALLTRKDLEKLASILIDDIESKKPFDPNYYYLLANSLDNLTRIGYGPKLQEKIDARLQAGADAQTKKALTFLSMSIPGTLYNGKAFFRPERYRAQDGKSQVIQIFDKADTQSDHWLLTQDWARSLYGAPKTGSSGELIYENNRSRMILFMGSDEEGQANQAFLRAQLLQNPNMILTFRGHSFSLRKNMPSDIFGNPSSHILFIPGSCGSSGTIPGYISQNQNTDLRMVSNSGLGRGQVTNELLRILIGRADQPSFDDLLKENANRIQALGGDVNTIKIWNNGEALLDFVYHFK
jgi:hypothetical protein